MSKHQNVNIGAGTTYPLGEHELTHHFCLKGPGLDILCSFCILCYQMSSIFSTGDNTSCLSCVMAPPVLISNFKFSQVQL